jgi:hypothetical protein
MWDDSCVVYLRNCTLGPCARVFIETLRAVETEASTESRIADAVSSIPAKPAQ